MFAFGGMQLTRYKQRVLTRRARANADTVINLPAFNDWHLVKVWVVGSGGRGGNAYGSGASNVWEGAGGGGGPGVAIGRYQADPLIRTDYTCNVGGGNGARSDCTFYDSALGANRTLTGLGGGVGSGYASGAGGAGGTATGGQINATGGHGGHGNGKAGGGGGINGADGGDSNGGNQNAGAGRGANGNDVSGIRAEALFWGYQICCGSQGGLPSAGGEDATAFGCGAGGGGGRLQGTRQNGTVTRHKGWDSRLAGGGGGGQRDPGPPGEGGDGGRGQIFILY